MVLQRDVPLKIWGWAAPGEQISVFLAGQQKQATTSADGKWSVLLEPLRVGAAQTLTVRGSDELVIHDVQVGEVWLGAGQSNMEWPVAKTTELPAVVADANQPTIRVFTAANTPAHDPMDDVAGRWVVCTPETVTAFPAVAYEFARHLDKALNVPVGMLTASIGGTPAESWTSLEALSKHPDFKAAAETQIAEMAGFEDNKKKFLEDLAAWEKQNGGDSDHEPTAAMILPAADDADWQDVSLPAPWTKIGLNSGGAVWFSKRFGLQEQSVTQQFLINAGNVSYGVRAFLNGKELQQVQGAQPMFCLTPRLFVVPPGLAKAQDNVLALRVFTHTDLGQYGYTLADMWFPLSAPGAENIWRKKVEFVLPPIDPARKALLPVSPSPAPQLTATYNYNGLINPLTSYAVRGVIWYQGESNVERADDYARLFSGLVADWRNHWRQPSMPFYFVQLPNFGGWPTVNAWARLREQQATVARTVEHTGMAVAIDLGQSKDIHPPDKREVSRRLSALALRRTYGQNVPDAAADYRSMETESGSIRLKFSPTKDALAATGGSLAGFTIAGQDQRFITATATIEGSDVVVSSRLIKEPVAVRYAWSNDPTGCNLQSANGFPVAPFRTDRW